MFPEWNFSPLHESTKMRRNGETLQADGSGKSYRKETNFPNSWMNTRKYTLRIFLVTVTTLWMILSMDLDTDLTQDIQSTEVLHISIPCNSATHKVITSGETGECARQMASVCNLNILPATAGYAAGQAVKSCQFLWQIFPSDYSADYSVHTDDRHPFIYPSSRGSHRRSFRPTGTSGIQPLRPGTPPDYYEYLST